MATASKLTDAEVQGFLKRLHEYRATLSEADQRLLDAMYMAASGKHEEKDEDMHAYWVAAGPRGVAVGGPVGVAASPWDAAYGAYYPHYY